MKTVLVRSVLEELSPRVTRNAQTLASKGYEVTVLAWDREAKNPKFERKDGYQARRFKFRAPSGFKILLFLPIWWLFEFFWLMKNHWDIVHAMDFDTVPPAVVAAKMKRKLVIYEIADVYEDMMILPQLLRNISVFIDKIFMRLVNGVIIAGPNQIEGLGGIPNHNVSLVYSSPPDILPEAPAPIERDDTFTIFYAGMLRRNRQLNLDKVFQAVMSTEEVRLIIAGYGDLAEEVEKWAGEAQGKVQFLGRISYSEVLERTMTANLALSLYWHTPLSKKYSGGNKLFEAMMCNKPILVGKDTAMVNIVEGENCGLVVDPTSVGEIKEAIVRLKENPDLCQQLGANGRRAYEQKYSWKIMEQRLLALYQKIK